MIYKRMKADNRQQVAPEVAGSRAIGSLATIGVLGLGGYVVYLAVKEYTKNRALKQGDLLPPSPDGNGGSSVSPSVLPKGNNSNANDSFPLKKGSRGTRVRAIQHALLQKGGTAAMHIRTTGGADGIFGNGTQAALTAAGFSTVVSESEYHRLTAGMAGSATPSIVTGMDDLTAKSIASELKSALGLRPDIGRVMAAMQKMNSPQDYVAVRSAYGGSLVNATLSKSVRLSETDKQRVRQEFLRMGLTFNATTQKWSTGLDGLFGLNGGENAIVTIKDTWVRDLFGNYFKVPLGTYLGEKSLSVKGLTRFENIVGETYYTPSIDVINY